MSWRRHALLFPALIVLLNLAVLELMSYEFAIHFLRHHGVLYAPEVPDQRSFAEYLAIRDPVLGWPAPGQYGTGSRDSLGSRRNTFFPEVTAPACISTYGDSFTRSSEVGDEAAWPNQLSRLLNCRVNNFGEGGYGTDQAVLRFQRNRSDRPPVVVLGYTSENIIRNVNQFRYFIGGEQFGFKPRFVKNASGQYALDPIIDFGVIAYPAVYLTPWTYFKHDYFVPDGPSGLPYLRVPYSVSVIRSFFSYKFKGFMGKTGSYLAPFYEPGHPSQALEVTSFIIRLFRAEALQRGSLPLVVLIPIADDLFYYRERKIWPYQSLLSDLNNALKVEVVNFGQVLFDYADREHRQLCEFYREEWYAKTGCTGHFNEEGYLLLARTVAGELRELGILEHLAAPRVQRAPLLGR